MPLSRHAVVLLLAAVGPVDAQSLSVDLDQDGFASAASGGDDCDDLDAAVNPGAIDDVYDGVDADCDGRSDDDFDRDGHDALEWGGDDCDDRDEQVHPGAAETWYDGIDADCDGADDFDADGDGERWSHFPGSRTDRTGAGDCDDADAAISPRRAEVAADGLDNDCDGIADES